MIVEDDPSVREAAVAGIKREDWEVRAAGSIAEAEAVLSIFRPDVLVLDLTLPDGSGWSLFDYIDGDETQVIVVTARADVATRVKAIRGKRADYLCKPFFEEELFARIDLHLAARGKANKSIRLGSIELDPETRTASAGGQSLDLTPSEFAILAYLCARPGRLCTREVLAEQACSPDGERQPRTLDSHISRIRRKLGGEGARLTTVWGRGWTMSAKAS